MILLDTDLEPDPTPDANSAKGPSARAFPVISREHRLPTTRTLEGFLRKAQTEVRLRGHVTVLLTTDATIRRLNRQFRGKDKATDVLSFPAEGVGADEIAGDLAISVSKARRQAVERGHALRAEIKVLMLHGLLHLAGYDHETDAGRMARRERLLRSRLGLPLGLIERSDSPLHWEKTSAPLRGEVPGLKPAESASAIRGAEARRSLPGAEAPRSLRGTNRRGFAQRGKPRSFKSGAPKDRSLGQERKSAARAKRP